MKRILLFFILISVYTVKAQVGTGEWRFHVATAKAIDVATNGNQIYTAYENGLSVLDLSDYSHTLYTALTGLSDIEISCIYFDEVHESLFIGYVNGNIDKLKNGRIYNIPALKLAQIPNSKRINHFEKVGDFVLAANDCSILKVDPIKNEVKDTYYPTGGLEKIQDVVFQNDTLYALTPSRLLRGLYNNPALPDQSQWALDSRLPLISNSFYSELTLFNDKLTVLYKNETSGAGDSVFCVTNSGTQTITLLPFAAQINSINQLEEKLAVNINGGCILYNSAYNITGFYSSANFDKNFNLYRSAINTNGLWTADEKNGLVHFPNEVEYKVFPISGSYNKNFYSMDCQDGKLAIASGSLSGKMPSFTRNGVHFFESETWSSKNKENTPEWQNKDLWDILDVSINSKNIKNIAISTYSPEPLTVFKDNQATCYNITNSTLELSNLGNGWAFVSDVCYDEKGNLWALNAYCNNPLNVLDNNNEWKNFDCGFQARNKFTKKMIVDFDNNLWFSILDEGLYAYNYNGTVNDASDDEYKQITTGSLTGNLPSSNVTAIAADFNGEIWIGTDAGFAILYNANDVFTANSGEYNAQRIKINFEGNVEYLLGATHITDIEIDGGNRKWIATANAGILLLSADGSEILEQHTSENSPLISNNIFDLKLDQKSGELFIITDKGLVSYRTNATYEDPDYESTIVFPNPVRPNFSGPVTIQGIRYDSDVKITDVAGNLVFKTTSNGGTATWDCKNLSGQKVASGVYFIWTATNVGKDKKVGKVLILN